MSMHGANPESTPHRCVHVHGHVHVLLQVYDLVCGMLYAYMYLHCLPQPVMYIPFCVHLFLEERRGAQVARRASHPKIMANLPAPEGFSHICRHIHTYMYIHTCVYIYMASGPRCTSQVLKFGSNIFYYDLSFL